MKLFLLLAGSLLVFLSGFSQVAINTDGSLPNPNAILDLKSGTMGLLIPRMDSTSRKAMPNIFGMVIYDSTTSSPWYNTGSQWVNLGIMGSGSSGDWSTTGNAETVDGTNFLGTTDNIPLSFRVNNLSSGRIDPNKGTTFFGYQSGGTNVYGNSAYGYQALFSNTGGINNLANGWSALYSNTSGNDNTANGTGALYTNTTGNYNSAVGYDALNMNTTGNNNSGTGYFSLGYNSTGNNNTANGYNSLFNNISGSGNVAIGSYALSTTTGASGMVAVGDSALLNNSTGNGNTAMGYLAAYSNTTGSDNVAIGISALSSNTSASNVVAVGDSALFNNTQTRNTAVGSQALFQNTTGGDNTGVGYGALENNNSGYGNSGFGSQARTGQSSFFNTVLGYNTTSVDGIMDATAIGSNATVGASYTIQLGDDQVTAVNSYGTFNTISDGRFKFNIREDVSGLDFIMKLRPVTYQLDTRKIDNDLAVGYTRSMDIRRTGFIAQEVEKAADETGFNFDGVKKPQTDQDHYSLSYAEFVVPLVKAVQEQQQQINELKQENEALRKAVTALLNKQTPGQ